jgi:hypothetical protein
MVCDPTVEPLRAAQRAESAPAHAALRMHVHHVAKVNGNEQIGRVEAHAQAEEDLGARAR